MFEGVHMIDGDKKADNSSILRFLGCAVLAASIIIAIICAVFASGDIGCSRCLCPAQTRSQTLTASSLITFEIPPNAGITKIYASFVQSEDSPIEGGEIMILSPSAMSLTTGSARILSQRSGHSKRPWCNPYALARKAPHCFSTIGQIEANVLNVTVVYCP